MFRRWLIFLVLFISALPKIAYGEQHDFQSNGVSYVWESQPNCAEAKEVFLDAFLKSYSQVPLEVLRQPSRPAMVEWLDQSFDETYEDHKNSKNLHWLSAKVQDKVVGFLLLDTTQHPEEIYLAQLAVAPAFQGKGIASSMIRSLFDQFPECRKFVVITRRANEEARQFYNALEFTSSSYMHEGYSDELYEGFEYRKKQLL